MRRFFLVLVGVFAIAFSVNAQTSSTSGAWSTGTNWIGNTAPTESNISANVIVNNAMTFASSASFTGWGSTTITINNGGSVKITGDLSMTGGGINFIINTGGTLEVTGTITANNSSQITLQGGTVKAGTLTMPSFQSSKFNYTSGTLTLTGSLYLGGSEVFSYTPSLSIPGNVTILNGSALTVTSLGGTIELSGSSKLTLNTGGSLSPSSINFSGSSSELVVASGTLNYSLALTINSDNKLTLNAGTTNLQALTVGSAGTVSIASGATLTATSLSTTSNSNAIFNNAGTASITGSVDSYGVITNSGTMNVSGTYTQENSGNSTTNSGKFNITGNAFAYGLIQLNPGTSADSDMIISGSLTVDANPWVIVGTTVSACASVITYYADLVVKTNLILIGSGDVIVRQNGRMVVFGNIVASGSSGGNLVTVDCGGQVYVDGKIDLGTGGGNTVTNSNNSSSRTGSDGNPVIGLYVNGTTTAQVVSGTVGTKSQLETNDYEFFLWIGTLPSSPLPVKLIYFTISAINTANVSLTWATSMEKNFSHFELEHAGSDLAFASIATINGKGAESVKEVYNFNDQLPFAGKNYYRLKSVDLDGSFEYSDVILAELTGNSGVKIYPTLVSDGFFFVQLGDSYSKPVRLEMMDAMGHPVYASDLTEITSTVEFPTSALSGIYLVKLSSSQSVVTRIFKK
ncbi:MAG TPA: hypothetical protein VIN08_06615 [Ohtaekwangia sp.]|uniref:hypothetical protein n=1 Tax=Ohtaekwangia sp. TaxID=2066019 RepID=UPI002F92ACF1